MRHTTAVIFSCLLASSATAQDGPRVVAVNYALQYFAERLLGDDAEVVFPVPEGVDPSFWRPSIADVSTIQSADLILLSGAGFATWVDRVTLPRARLLNTSAAYTDSFIETESITHSHGDGDEHSHDTTATYTWLDPMLAIAQAEAVATAVINRGLSTEDAVGARLMTLQNDLETLDAETRSVLSGAADAVIVATHPRYQYLARAYGLTILSLEWDAGAAPDEAGLNDLQTMIDQQGASVLIWEAEPPQAALDATASLGLANVIFSPLASQPTDATFITAFQDAVSTLADATAR